MAAPVKLEAIFTKAETLSDNSVKLIFASQELAGADTARLFDMKGKACWLVLAPDDSVEAADIPEAPPREGERKTQGQRLRAVLFRRWEQIGRPGDFNDWYRQAMERHINDEKAKLDD